MARDFKLKVNDFRAGWLPDLPVDAMPENGATDVENSDFRNLALQAELDIAAYTDLPTGLTIITPPQKFAFTVPSYQVVTIVHGTLAGRERIYVKPFLTINGTWDSSQWWELTESEGPYTTTAGTGTTSVFSSGAFLQSTADYYNKWILFNHTLGRASYIEDYASGGPLTLYSTITGQTTGQSFQIFRFPVYACNQNTANLKYLLSAPDGVRYMASDNVVRILTGPQAYSSNVTGVQYSDFFLTTYDGLKAFNDSDFDYSGMYFTRRNLDAFTPTVDYGLATEEQMITVQLQSGSGLPAGDYVVLVVPVYDGYQESSTFLGASPYDRTIFHAPGAGVGYRIAGLTTEHIDVTVDFFIRRSINGGSSEFVPLANYNKNFASAGPWKEDCSHIVYDRRVQKLLFYVAPVNASYAPTDDYRLSGVLDINSPLWTRISDSHFRANFDIFGSDYSAGSDEILETRQGHEALWINANAKFGAVVNKKAVYGDAYSQQYRADSVFSTAQQNNVNAPDVVPDIFNTNLLQFNLARVVNFEQSAGYIIITGDNQSLVYNPETQSIVKRFDQQGGIAEHGSISFNENAYFVDTDDIFVYTGRHQIIRSLARDKIREYWKSLDAATKQAAAMSYDRKRDQLLIAVGTTVLTFNLPRALASEEVSDYLNAEGAWGKYLPGVTFTWLVSPFEATDKSIGLVNDGTIKSIYAAATYLQAEWKSKVFDGPLVIDAVKLYYQISTGNPQVEIYDLARSTTSPVYIFTFPKMASLDHFIRYKEIEARRLQFKLILPSGKIDGIEINPQGIDNDR